VFKIHVAAADAMGRESSRISLQMDFMNVMNVYQAVEVGFYFLLALGPP